MTETIQLELTDMAHGGAALGRDEGGRVIFVPGGIPGETVTVTIVQDKGRFAQATLQSVDTAAAERITPRCAHFGDCGGCHWQHIPYERQLMYKNEVLRSQWERAKLDPAGLQPILANPELWAFQARVDFSPAAENKLGFWSPAQGQVMAIERCEIIRPALQTLYEDIDLDLEPLRKLSLLQGDDEALLIALEVHGVEPPSLSADFPVSVAIVLPDQATANLIGDNYVVRTVRDHDFRVSAGVPFPASSAAADMIVAACLALPVWTAATTVLEVGVGAGLLTAFIAPQVAAVSGSEANGDAVADAAINLDATDNVSLYESEPLAALAALADTPDVILVTPGERGVHKRVLPALLDLAAPRLVYNSENLATLIRDGRRLRAAGYRPVTVQPIDTRPHHFEIHTLSLWEKEKGR